MEIILDFDKAKLEKFRQRIDKGAIVKAIKGWKNSSIPYKTIESDLLNSIDKAYETKNVSIILSAYYQLGKFAKYEILDLLNIMFEKKDYPSFLKQAYRFGIYEELKSKINYAINWHEERKMQDAFAWKLKFEKLKESQDLIDANFDDGVDKKIGPIKILDEEQSEQKRKFIYLELKPIERKSNKGINNTVQNLETQPYILSQASRKKFEDANQKHSFTLEILRNKINEIGCEVIETKHIDAFSIIKNIPAIFEVKSINEDNETDQVRAAISQLYEYRFLYSLFNATLWIVFSEKPFSDWIVDYLSKDREIKVLWVNGNKLEGTSIDFL